MYISNLLLFQIFYLCLGVIYSISALQESTVQPGMSFTPQFKLILTVNNYIVPFTIRIDVITEPVRRAENLTTNTIHNLDKVKDNNFMSDLILRHVFEFESKFKELHFAMNDFLIHILGYNLNDSWKNRHTRGVLSIVGSIANTLFGTATQDQIDHIHEKLQSLNSFTEQERKILNVHSHILNVTLGDLTNVHQALNKLKTAPRMTEKLFNTVNAKIA